MKRLTIIIMMGFLIASLVLSACASSAAPVTPAATHELKPSDTPQGTQPTQPAAAGGGTKIRVATDASWPPFEMVNESTKQIEGFDVDLMNAIAANAGLQVEFVNVAFDPLLAGMAQCQYDASISAMTITDERKQSMAFSDPYFEAGQIITVQANNTDITGKDSLTGKTLGAQIGTTGAIEAGKIPGATAKTYDDIGLAFQDLINGQVDAVIADTPLALGYVGKNPTKIKTVGEPFTDENYGIAVCKNKPELVAKINEGLAKAKADGVIDQLTKKWISGGQ